MNKELKEIKRIKLRNKKLVKKYPWLKPRNVWTGKTLDDYDYSNTWLDDMPLGWRKAFGLLMVEEIDRELRKYHYENKYQIVQIKEKFGGLRWYDNGQPGKVGSIITKYGYISENICLECGKLDTPMLNTGWIYPICFDCYKRNKQKSYKYTKQQPKTNEELMEMYKECCDVDNCKICNSYTIRRYAPGNDKYEDVVYDISDTVQKVRTRNKRR